LARAICCSVRRLSVMSEPSLAGERVGTHASRAIDELGLDRALLCALEHLLQDCVDGGAIARGNEIERVHGSDLRVGVSGDRGKAAIPAQHDAVGGHEPERAREALDDGRGEVLFHLEARGGVLGILGF
jgi:hypothetical protein